VHLPSEFWRITLYIMNFICMLTLNIFTKKINKNYLIIYRFAIIFYLMTKMDLYEILQFCHQIIKKKNPSHHNHPFLIARIWPSKPNNHLETLEHAITHSYLFMNKITRAFRLVYMSNLNIAQFPRFFHA
jgi:hypothetical protein